MAAAARSPGPSDARVPCPQCGGLIHPIAGRCKHCKADLAAIRSTRPAAAAALPPLSTLVATATITAAAPRAMPAVEEAQPILPPRPTGRHHASAGEPAATWWKSWPIVVIVLAGIAIIIAILLLVLPSLFAAEKTDAHLIPPPGPAPDRMDTNPMTPGGGNPPHTPGTPGSSGGANGADPWGQHGKAAPNPNRRTPPDPVPNPDPDDDDLANPFGGGGGTRGGLGLGGAAIGMFSAMAKHGCDRLTSCGGVDPAILMACDSYKQVLGGQNTQVPSCAAAQRCLAQIDQLDCDTKLDDFSTIIGMQSKFRDCLDAMSC